MSLQGKLRVQRRLASGAFIGLVEPEEHPEDWFFVPLPTLEFAKWYANEHQLEFIEEYEDYDDDD